MGVVIKAWFSSLSTTIVSQTGVHVRMMQITVAVKHGVGDSARWKIKMSLVLALTLVAKIGAWPGAHQVIKSQRQSPALKMHQGNPLANLCFQNITNPSPHRSNIKSSGDCRFWRCLGQRCRKILNLSLKCHQHIHWKCFLKPKPNSD